jgi:folate-binding protein YgfZ
MSQPPSPFTSLFEAHNATFEATDVPRLPLRVSDFNDEYEAALERAALFDRSHRTRLRVGGGDAESFLHNMLTAHVKRLGTDRAEPALFLTNKGKVVADFLLMRDKDAFLLDVETSGAQTLVESLSRYVISEDVTIERAQDTSFSLEGARAAEALEQFLSPTGTSVGELSDLGTIAAGFESSHVRVTARHRFPSPRFDVIAPEREALALADALVSMSDPPALAGHLVAEARRIEAGEPRLGYELDGTQLPQEAALDDAISFDKGCYIGQEYVVRLAHRGQVSKRLSGLTLSGDEVPPRGASVRVGEEQVGELTSCSYSPRLSSAIALAYLKRGSFEPGQEVAVVQPSGVSRSGQVESLPFPRS